MKPADNIPIFYIICLPPVFGRLFIAMTGGGSQCPSGWKMLDRLWRTVHHEIAASSAIDDDVVSDVNCARKQAVHFHLPGARMEINKTSVTSWSQWKHNILVAWLNNKLSYTVEQLGLQAAICKQNATLLPCHVILTTFIISKQIQRRRTSYHTFLMVESS